MSPDTPDTSGPAAADPSAGALLRAAREKQGLHIAALAASIKVSPRKLEALENDRYGELPDATFVRALAQTVCRNLKTDPAPVLARLPKQGASTLAHVAGTLNTPFRERQGRFGIDVASSNWMRTPLVWAAVLLVLAAVAVALMPASWWQPAAPTVITVVPAVAPPASVAAGAAASAALVTELAASAAAPVVETVHAAPPQVQAEPAGLLQVRSTAPSWVQVEDSAGQRLLSRTVQPGEALVLGGKPPFKLHVGNVAATQITLRGQRVDLGAAARDNIARVELP
ncbi:MAG: helix-turn-helix domain-containing protein [Rubrivivax sp.]|nr:helix-turn-helix domain-containing protein [Rubrivivax sp.]